MGFDTILSTTRPVIHQSFRTTCRRIGRTAGIALLLATAGTSAGTAASLPGTFKGEAYGTFATAVVGPIAATLGKTAFLPCPCQGTNGATQQTSVNGLSAGTGGKVLTANTVTSTVYGLKTTTTAKTTTTSTISGLNLLDGMVTATTIKAVANSNATATDIAVDAKGSTFVNLVVAGVPIAANPAPGTRITLPGIGSVVLNQATKTGKSSKAKQITVEMLTVEVSVANSFGLPIGARIVVAHAVAGYTRSTLPFAVGGQAFAAAANATIGSSLQTKIGKAALVSIGCDGTDGVTRTGSISDLDVGSVLSIGAGNTTAFGGKDGAAGTVARTTATVEDTSLLELPVVGALVKLSAITVVAEDKYNGSVHTRSTSGTQFVGLKIAGISVPINVAPNFRIDLPFGYVIINEQKIPAAAKKGVMSVNGLRIVITGVNVLGLPVGSQITVAHAEATAQR